MHESPDLLVKWKLFLHSSIEVGTSSLLIFAKPDSRVPSVTFTCNREVGNKFRAGMADKGQNWSWPIVTHILQSTSSVHNGQLAPSFPTVNVCHRILSSTMNRTKFFMRIGWRFDDNVYQIIWVSLNKRRMIRQYTLKTNTAWHGQLIELRRKLEKW